MNTTGMTILVTGANGLFGVHVTKALLEAGFAVRALVRCPENRSFVHPEMEIVAGNFTDAGQINAAAAGCGAIVHVAAETSPHGRHRGRLSGVNVEGTKRVMEAARCQGVPRVIYVSTANTIGYGDDHVPGTETRPMRAPFTRIAYALSKQQAEEWALQYGSKNRISVVVVNPCFLIGPYGKPSGSSRILARMLGKKIVWAPPGGKNFVSGRSAAAAVAQAVVHGRPGERYLLTGENRSYAAFYELARRVSGERFRIVVLPAWTLVLVGIAGNLLTFLGVRHAFALSHMQALSTHCCYDGGKASLELKLPSSDLERAIRETIAWLRDGRESEVTALFTAPLKTEAS